MALVVFLRGLNVGGRRNFRPGRLARELQHLDVVNIGAAGTFVVRETVSPATLKEEISSRLPYKAEIMICEGKDISELMSIDFQAENAEEADLVHFISILSHIPKVVPDLPLIFPPGEKWFLKVVAHDGRFIRDVYERDMKVIGYLGQLDKIFGLPITTRNWDTMTRIDKVLQSGVK